MARSLEPAAVWTCRIRPFGVEIAIGCDPALIPAVERHLSPWSPRVAIEPRPPALQITQRQRDGLYILCQEDRVVFTALQHATSDSRMQADAEHTARVV